MIAKPIASAEGSADRGPFRVWLHQYPARILRDSGVRGPFSHVSIAAITSLPQVWNAGSEHASSAALLVATDRRTQTSIDSSGRSVLHSARMPEGGCS